jgi:hypothetical protein
MRSLKRFRARLTNFATRRQDDQRLQEEIEAHLALQTADNLRAGMAPEEARRRAVLKFGAVQVVKEDYRAEQGLPFIDNTLQDLRYAFRMLMKSPGFAAAAILTMAVGIGATAAIFSVVDATLLQPLPLPEPQQLVRIEADFPGVGARDVRMSQPEWKDLQRSGIFQYVSPVVSGSVNLTGASQPARIVFKGVAPGYLALLGVSPRLGRWFDPQDQTPGYTQEVVISDGLWHHRRDARRFSRSGANPAAKEHGAMGSRGFCRGALVGGAQSASPPEFRRASPAGIDDCRSTEPSGCTR